MHQLLSKPRRALATEASWVVAGQLITTLGALVGVRLLTSVLSPAHYGELALGLTLALLVGQVLLLPLRNATLRFLATARHLGETNAFSAAMGRLLGIATAIVLLLAIVCCAFLYLTDHSTWIPLAIASFIFALLSGYASALDAVQSAARRRSVVAWHQALACWARFLLAAALILLLGAGSAVAMLGYATAAVIVLASQVFFLKNVITLNYFPAAASGALRYQWETQMFAYAWPFAAWGAFTWAQLASDRWALQLFTTTTDVGLYTVLYQLGVYPTVVLTQVLSQFLAPLLFQRVSDTTNSSRMRQVERLTRWITISSLIVVAIAVLAALCLHTLIFEHLVAPHYRSVSWLLPGTLLAGGLLATGDIAALSILSGTDSRPLMLPKISSAIIGIGLNSLGAYLFGLPGVICAAVITSTVYLFSILYLVNSRDHSKSDEWPLLTTLPAGQRS